MKLLLIIAVFLSGCAAHRPVKMYLSREKPRDACRQVDEDIRNGYKTWECVE